MQLQFTIWAALGCYWTALGGSWAALGTLGRLRELLGGSWAAVGQLLGSLGGSGRLWELLGGFWPVLGRLLGGSGSSWAAFGQTKKPETDRDDTPGEPRLVIPVHFGFFGPRRAGKTPKRTGMTILGSTGLSSQSVFGFCGRRLSHIYQIMAYKSVQQPNNSCQWPQTP